MICVRCRVNKPAADFRGDDDEMTVTCSHCLSTQRKWWLLRGQRDEDGSLAEQEHQERMVQIAARVGSRRQPLRSLAKVRGGWSHDVGRYLRCMLVRLPANVGEQLMAHQVRCGALVFRGEERIHALEVHGLEVDDREVGRLFVAVIETPEMSL